jgi:uncharacterized protein YjbI with pentapeptide repeats
MPSSGDATATVPLNTPQRSEMTQERLATILESHRTWLDTRGNAGTIADLSSHDLRRLDFANADLRMAIFRNADLTGADLHGLDLTGADLSHAQLSESNLRGAVLRITDLTGANLQNAQVYDADLYGAKLHEVDLTKVQGLVQCQLSGTDLSNAQLPADAGKFAGLEHVSDISVQARNLLWATVGACFFAAVTTIVTTDGVLVAHSGSTLLPVVQINVPIITFFWLMPLILLSLYLYLHFQLQYLWDGLASLPSVFPDGVGLEEKAYPLFLVGLAHQYVPILEKNRPPLSWLRGAASIASAWGLVPFTIFLCWLRYLRVHEIWGTAWHIVLLTLTIWFGMAAYGLTVETLRGEKHPQPCVDKRSYRLGYQLVARHRIVIVFVAAVLMSLWLVTVAVLYPGWIGKDEAWINPDVKDEITSLRKWFCPDLSYSVVSHRPDDWFRLTDADQNLVGVKGALLAGVNLRGADGTGAFLAKATLDKADLQGANFSEADLRESSLNWAKLRNAQLEHAKLSGAHLDNADLRGAKLKSATMPGATLWRAQLNDANLYGAQLQKAYLEEANLEKADLGEADLHGANLKHAKMPNASLWKAQLNGADLFHAKLQKAILQEANLEEANLGRTNLAGTKLQGANVRSAGFAKAKFQDTELQGVDLSQAKDLTREQLEGACGDERTKLPAGFGTIKDCGTRN